MSNETEPSLPLDIPEQSEAVAGQKIGYARVSSKDQNLDRQTAALKRFLITGRTPRSCGRAACIWHFRM